MCTIHANTSKVAKAKKKGPNGAYYVQEFEIVLLCGLTELKAQIRWKENVSGFLVESSNTRLTIVSTQGEEKRYVGIFDGGTVSHEYCSGTARIVYDDAPEATA